MQPAIPTVSIVSAGARDLEMVRRFVQKQISVCSPLRSRLDGPALVQQPLPAVPWLLPVTLGSRSIRAVPEAPKKSPKTPLSASPDPGIC